MTITATASQISYAGNGVTLAFAIPFVFDTSADIKVIKTSSAGVPSALSTGFAITGGGGSTGICTMTVAPAVGEKLTLLDNPELTQPVDYTDNDAFAAETHERALDRTERQVKRLHQRVDRSIRVLDGDLVDGDSNLLPISSTRANKFLAFDAAGAPTVSVGTGGGDAALRTDLASTTTGANGSALSGFKRTEAGAVATTVRAILAGAFLTPQMFGVVPGASAAANNVALQAWLTAIPLDGAGFIPPDTATYNFDAALTRTNRCSIYGGGRASCLNFTGAGVALTFNDARSGRLENWLLVGTAAAAGGVYVKSAQESFGCDSFTAEGFTGATSYAMRISDSWDITIVGGALRQSRKGIWCDTTDLGAGGIVNTLTVLGTDCSECETSIDYQAGQALVVLGVDCGNGGAVVAPLRAIEVGRGLVGAKFCTNAYIGPGTWFEGTGAGLAVGRNNTSSATPTHVRISQAHCDVSGEMVRLFKADRCTIGQNEWGLGTITIDAGVTRTVVETEQAITDNSTAGQTTYIRQSSLEAPSIVARGDLQSGMNRFRVNRNAVVQAINSGAPTKVQWTTEDLDTPAAFDNAVNFRWTPTKAGWYRVRSQLQLQAMAAGNFMQLSIYKNGTRHRCTNLYVAAAGAPTIAIDALCQANGTTDFFEIFIEHNNGVAKNVEGAVDSSWMEGHPAV